MYVAINNDMRAAYIRGLDAKIQARVKVHQQKVIGAYPGLADLLVRENVPAELYHLPDMMQKVFGKRSIPQNVFSKCEEVTIYSPKHKISCFSLSLIPPLLLPYYARINHVVQHDQNQFVITQSVQDAYPGLIQDLEFFDLMHEDHKQLKEFANTVLYSTTSLKVLLEKAPYLSEFVDSESLSALNQKSPPREKKIKPPPAPISTEEQEAILLASTRLRIS